MKMRKKIWRKLAEMIIDFLLIIFAFSIAYYVRVGQLESSNFPFAPYLEISFLITPIFVFLLAWIGLYSFKFQTLFEKFRIISISCLTGAMVFVLVFFFKREVFFSRLIVFYIFILSTIFVWGFHSLGYYWDRSNWKNKKQISRVLVIGANKAAEKAILHMQKNYTESCPVAILAPYGARSKNIHNVPVLGKLDALEKVIKEYGINEILQCDAIEQTLNLLVFAEGNFLRFKMSPEIIGAYHDNIASENISGVSMIILDNSPLFGWGQFFKRIFDVLVSFIFLIIFLPIFFMIFIFRKIISPKEPIIIKEVRSRGFEGSFKMFRFYVDNKTKWGKFIKQKFLQDCPSLLNVFVGSMSLVGPRPLLTYERDCLPLHYKRRLILKPGITGLWQLEKIKSKNDDFERMIELDVKYIYKWSFIEDLKILIKTCKEFIGNFKISF